MAITREQFNNGTPFVHNGIKMELGTAGYGRCVFFEDVNKKERSAQIAFDNHLGFKLDYVSGRFIYYSDCIVWDEMMVLPAPKPEELYTCPCCSANYVLKN